MTAVNWENFANKIWNARFLTMNAEKLNLDPAKISHDQLQTRSNDIIMGLDYK